MSDQHRFKIRIPAVPTGLVLLAVFCLGLTSCGFSHREGRRTETYLGPGAPKPNNFFREASYPVLQAALPTIADAEFLNDDELCVSCHKTYAETFRQNLHRGLQKGQSCEACHGPCSQHVRTKGKEPGLVFSFRTMTPVQKSEVCARCHEENVCAPGANWRTSVHAHNNVSCTDCHRGHYNVPPGTPATTEPQVTGGPRQSGVQLASFNGEAPSQPSLRGTSNFMGAEAPNICFKCHGDMAEYARIAGPHQICGPNGFNCTTCHDPHGKIYEQSRKDLCLSCHQPHSPTMAWHSSTHDLHGVACTDCHNPHPRTGVQQFVNISHTNVTRPKRMQMSVQEPQACYKCHPKIFALASLPSHHPIMEGKLICSDCHDPHGQRNGNLKADGLTSVNLLCYKCHMEKQGPFAYPHPPVDENCSICHEPHGTVTNNLLRQPPNFLCLRCHVGHRQTLHGHQIAAHSPAGTNTNNMVPSLRSDIDRNAQMRQAFYSDCTACHAQIHGSDLASGRNPGVLMR